MNKYNDKPVSYSYETRLACPGCSTQNLHHWRVEVFHRGEDKEKGLHVDIGRDTPPPDDPGEDVHIDSRLTGNPSRRRHGLKVYFYCENCSVEPVLCLAQHKGETELYWDADSLVEKKQPWREEEETHLD